MNQVTGFRLAEEGYELEIDRDPGAVFVYAGTGDVLVRDPGSAFTGAIEASSILGFRATRRDGASVLTINFIRDGAPDEILLGYADAEHARLWVDLVNRHYEGRGVSDLTPSGVAVDRYPVIHDILETGTNIVVPGDYLSSPDGHFPPNPYQPAWQELYAARVLDHLSERTGYPRSDLRNDWGGAPEHDYSYLADLIDYDDAVFLRRATLPLEFMFDGPPRRKRLDLIPVLQAEQLAIVTVVDSAAAKLLDLQGQEVLPHSSSEWLERLVEVSSGSPHRLSLGTPSQTSVDYLVNDAILRDLPELRALKVAQQGIPPLCQFLQSLNTGVVACDVGIAYQMRAYFRATQNPILLNFARLAYPRTVPVGLAYRRADSMWGEICHDALMDCFDSRDPEVVQSFKDTTRRAGALGMSALAA